MTGDKIVLKITPTPAAHELVDRDILRLSRITGLRDDEVRDRISKGRGIKIVTTQHPRIDALVKLMKSFGFSVDIERTPEQKPAAVLTPPPPTGRTQAPARAMTEWKVGDVIENLYEVWDIRYGGMGAVYIVRHMRWNIMMAVKSLYHRLRDSEEDRALFVKEAETWIDIGFHPNIAACYYVRNIQSSPRIFIEFADGGGLNEWVQRRERVGWETILDLMAQAGDGLGHAHSKGLVHRDVKPANCMLTKQGILKVTDFGLTKRRDQSRGAGADVTQPAARSGSDGQSVTAAGMGTPAFMAPEMWFPKAEVGPEADIYAFGVMFFEISCGRKPFVVQRGDKPNKLAIAHLRKPPPRPRSLRKDMPQPIEDIILKCLRKKPEERYRSFADVRKDVEEAYRELFKRPLPREAPDEVKLLSDAWNNRAVSLMDLHHEDEAREALEMALKSDPHHPEATYNLGLLDWFRSGNPDRELAVKLEEVIKTPEYTGRGAYLLGRCLLVLGDAQAALQACELSLTSEDATEGRLKTCAIALIGAGRDEDAISYLETYLAELPNDDEAWGWMLAALTRIGKVDEARRRLASRPNGSELTERSVEDIATIYRFSGLDERLVLQGHTGWVMCAGHFPNSPKFLTGSRDRTLRIWDSTTGKELKSIALLGEPPARLWISPDERLVAIAGPRPGVPVSVVDLDSGVMVGRLVAQERVTAVGFSRDGTSVITVEEKGAVRLWDTRGFKSASTFKVAPHAAAAAIFDEEGRPELFVTGIDRIVRRIQLTTNDAVAFERVHNEPIVSMEASPYGGRLVTGGKDKISVLWDIETGASLSVCRAHRDQVTELAISPRQNLVAGYDLRAGIKVWDPATGTVMRSFSVGDSQVHCLGFTPDGARLFAGGRDMLLHVWEVYGRPIGAEMALARTRPVKKQMISDREFKAMLATAQTAVNKRAYATAYSMLRRAQTLPGYERSDIALETMARLAEHGCRKGLHGGWTRKNVDTRSTVMDLAFSSSAINFFTAHADHTIRVWSTTTGECIRTLKGHSNLVASVALSLSGRELISGSDDRSVRTWDLNTGRSLLVLQGHTDSVSSVAYAPDGMSILSGSWDGTVRYWRLPDGGLLRMLKGHEGRVTAVSFVGRSDLIVSAGFDGLVKMWERSSGKLLRDLKGHRERITGLDVSPDGRLIMTGSMDGTVRVWDTRRGTAVRVLEVDEGGVRTVAFSPDKQFGLSAGNDAVLRIWNLETGACLRDFRGHAREITSAEFSSNGRFAISGSADGIVILWELDWDWIFVGQPGARSSDATKD